MRPADVEGHLSTALFHRYYHINGRVYMVFMAGVGDGPRGQSRPDPEREWVADFIHGEPIESRLSGVVFKADMDPDLYTRAKKWRVELLREVAHLGVREDNIARDTYWVVKESAVDKVLDALRRLGEVNSAQIIG
jgi:hypothetical protein